MAANYDEIANEILNAVGGAKNVQSVENCMTRLRFNLKDISKADKQAVEKMKGVHGVVIRENQCQVVLGPQSGDVFRALTKAGNIEFKDKDEEKVTGKISVWNKVLDTVVGSIAPLIPIIMTGGLIQAVASLLSVFKLISPESGFYQLLMFIGQAAFYFFPVFLGYSAAKKMNTSIPMGMLLGAVLLYPSLGTALAAEGGFRVFGLTVPNVSYGSQILPVFLGVWVMSYVEKGVDKVMPKVIKNLLTPLVTILIMVPLTLFVFGPIGGTVGGWFASLINWLAGSDLGWLAVAIIAGLAPFLVMAGMHVALFPIIITSISTVGYDPLILPAFLGFNTAAGAVALAVAIKTKNKNLKAQGFSAALSGYLGISEPSIYGIALKLKKPLISMIIGGTVGGLVAGLLHFKAYQLITAGLLALPSYVDTGNNLVAALIVIAVTTISVFVATYLYGFEDPKE